MSGVWTLLDVAVVRRETALALQLILTDGTLPWIPKSKVFKASMYTAGVRNCNILVDTLFWEQKQRELLEPVEGE